MYLSKKDHVKQALLNAILAGRLAPGTFLRQNDVAAQFGLSSTPVREALSELQSVGLLQHHAHRGFCVTRCDEDRVRQVYAARRIVEPETARLALRAVDAPCVDVMTDRLEEMKVLWQAGQHEAMAVANNAFHLELFQRSENRFLIDTIERLWNSLPRFVPWQAPGRMQPSIEEHQDILDATMSGKEKALGDAYQQHLDNAQTVFLEQLSVANHAEASTELPGAVLQTT